MAVNVLGVLGIVIFYIVILVIGIWAARARNRKKQPDDLEDETKEVILAGRSIGMFVGAFTMTGQYFYLLYKYYLKLYLSSIFC